MKPGMHPKPSDALVLFFWCASAYAVVILAVWLVVRALR